MLNLDGSAGAIAAYPRTGRFACWTTRLQVFGLFLFALSIPHSIAAAQISVGLSYLAWIVRTIGTGRFGLRATPIDLPLICFAALTTLSAIFSVEPNESIPKLRTLTLFGVFYLTIASLTPRGVRLLLALMMFSGLVGAGYSLAEKLRGRGMIITAVDQKSFLAAGPLLPGDVIWLIGKERIGSLEEAAEIIRQTPAGQTIVIEGLHEGDPLPVPLVVTEELKNQPNPLGVSVQGRSRRFRVSGFSRHFITYAEQMQIFALLSFGVVLSMLWKGAGTSTRTQILLSLGLLTVFSLGLIFTSSRAVIASFVLTMFLVSLLMREWKTAATVMLAVVAVASLSFYILAHTRTAGATSLSDDSSERRAAYMKSGLKRIPHHPLLGVGMDSAKRHWTEWGFPGTYITHTHSTPIQIAMDRGLPALGCYFWLMGVFFLTSWRKYRQLHLAGDRASAGLVLGAFAALAGFTASSLVNYNFGDSEVLMMLLCLMTLSVVASEGRRDGGIEGRRDRGTE
jgi:hypothetical protein